MAVYRARATDNHNPRLAQPTGCHRPA